MFLSNGSWRLGEVISNSYHFYELWNNLMKKMKAKLKENIYLYLKIASLWQMMFAESGSLLKMKRWNQLFQRRPLEAWHACYTICSGIMHTALHVLHGTSIITIALRVLRDTCLTFIWFKNIICVIRSTSVLLSLASTINVNYWVSIW